MIRLGQWILHRRAEWSELVLGEPGRTSREVADRIVRIANDSDMLFLTSEDLNHLR